LAVVAIAAAGAVGTVTPPPEAAAVPPADPVDGVVTYEPPVVASVHDPFRAPLTPYGPGNRGIEYDTFEGQRVIAAASGTVVFAGSVAGALHVTIGHADGVRTSYSFLSTIEVTKGQQLEQGDLVGRAGETFHFGARIGSTYVDPAALFGAGPMEVMLVPHDRPLWGSAVPSGRAASWSARPIDLFGSTIEPGRGHGALATLSAPRRTGLSARGPTPA
jgi:murein DD-endopeptidase MepM/ murein hydrolase activator NlpD